MRDDPELEAWVDKCWEEFVALMEAKETGPSFNPELAQATRSPAKCPRCGSPTPKLHPAVQLGGEVSICVDAFHGPLPKTEVTQSDREAAFFVSRMFLGNHDPMPDQLRSGELKRHILLDVLRNHRLLGGAQ